MRKEFEMTEMELKRILDASKPVPYLVFGGREPMSPQERANMTWESLGKKYRFDYMTVRPLSGKGQRFFTAEGGKNDKG